MDVAEDDENNFSIDWFDISNNDDDDDDDDWHDKSWAIL